MMMGRRQSCPCAFIRGVGCKPAHLPVFLAHVTVISLASSLGEQIILIIFILAESCAMSKLESNMSLTVTLF